MSANHSQQHRISAVPSSLVRLDGNAIRALIIDGDALSAELVSLALRRQGWVVSVVPYGSEAIRAARDLPPDIVVLEVVLPDMDGFDVMRELRAIRPTVPILVLSGQGTLEDRLQGLAYGGDDYVPKPFDVEEIVLRLRALATRSGIAVQPGLIVAGDLVLNEHTREVSRAGKSVPLTAKEFELLRVLMLNTRHLVSKHQLLESVWGSESTGNVNVLQIYISYLRKKIDDEGRWPMIHTVRGCGYILKPQ